jgi:lysophospholipid acyltransferase (LPLAT)-like uncharacterized protein
MNKLLFWLERKSAACLLKLIKATIRFEVSNQPRDDFRCVYMFWHRNLLLMTLQRMYSNVAVLVSSSKDGELIAGPIAELGYIPVRGSSTRQGSKALKEMIRLSQEHSLAITPDGPKGPAFTIHPGIYQLAILARIPIVPTVPHASREWVFKSWDRFRFPKPFCRIRVIYGDPVYIPDREAIPQVEEQLRETFKRLEEKAKGE